MHALSKKLNPNKLQMKQIWTLASSRNLFLRDYISRPDHALLCKFLKSKDLGLLFVIQGENKG